jgi:predicted ABC-type ATPase
LFEIYLPIVDGALIFDNSGGKYELLAEKTEIDYLEIHNVEKFSKMKNSYDKG